jgi:hypothetical protein
MILLKWDWALLLSYPLPSVVYVHTPKKSISQYQPFSSNMKKRKQGIGVFSTKLPDTLTYKAGKNKMIWFRPSVGETCRCTSVQHGATETVSTYLYAFVCSAVVGRVCQCKISAKYGCSVTNSAGPATFVRYRTALNPQVAWTVARAYPTVTRAKH